MKFRLSAAPPPFQGELHVESAGRFGNYFFSSGWLTGLGARPATFEYLFSGDRLVRPEYAFLGPVAGDDARQHFLHLFWMENGHQQTVGPESPVTLTLKGEKKGPPLASSAFDDLREGDYEAFRAAIECIGGREIWHNRLVMEMINHCGADDIAGFFAVALDRLGWHRMDEAVGERLSQGQGERALRDYLRFQCHCVSVMDSRYLPSSLREKFIHLIGGFQVSQSDLGLALDVIRQLAMVEPELACGFALSVITTLELERKDLATCLRHCFPQDSRWWIHHALENEELGPEQVADALNCAGTAAVTQGNAPLAMLAYEVAVRIDPLAQSPAWNAGWFRAGQGEIPQAAACFQRVKRHYANESLSTRWPHFKDLPWPVAPMDPGHFTLPAHASGWPRISVVTPSFNQGCYIEETILSILNQGYPNLQYIVVDGASTDETREVLERYRDRIDHLIIEKDNGQTEAINKGLRLADGELVAWMNSDDMYAPGALHVAALKWMESRADLIAGICVEHIDRRMLLLNKPAATKEDFNPHRLARIFGYWLKGFYFYQPEVFFSRKMLGTVGLLDESLYYSMDYDLWMRFAKAGAALEVVDWPFAFFRKHESQKTANLVDCVEEQSRVRSRHHELRPDEEREQEIRRGLASLKEKTGASIGILTKRMGKIFSASVQGELDRFCGRGFSIHLCDDERDPRVANADFVILLAHVLEDTDTIRFLREAKPDRLIAAWFWDNHHHLFENHDTAEAVDIVLPGHAIYGEYLRNDQALDGGNLPLCVTQWARQDAAEWFAAVGNRSRSGALYGGFVEYGFEPARTEFLRRVMDSLPGHALTILSESNLGSYFGRPEKDRFEEWCGYQTSLILPLRNDLSQRVFDALLAGLIPLVPEEIKDLDLVIPPELQASLPVLRFRMKDPASVAAAHAKALESFRLGGAAGVLARHRHALENHTFSSRINSILDLLDTL